MRYLWTNLLELILAAMLGALVLVVLAGVVSRYFVSSPLPWSEEVARYLFIWISFMGAGVGVKHSANFGLNLLAGRLSPRAHWSLEIAVHLVVACFGAVLAFYGWQILPIVGMQRGSSVPISLSYTFLAIPVGGALMLAFSLVRLRHAVRAFTTGTPAHAGEAVAHGNEAGGRSERRP